MTSQPTATVMHGDCRQILATIDTDSIDAIITDPPYELAFMGRRWDSTGVAFDPALWAQCLRVLKPGGHLIAAGGTRTAHRMVCAIEDAGFEIRDTICWLYSSGFPKSLDVSKAIDRAAGAERAVIGTRTDVATRIYDIDRKTALPTEIPVTAPATDEARRWAGWGTALKPAHEPLVLARKPPAASIATTVVEHGTGALNIDASRITSDDMHRWPANVTLDDHLAHRHIDWSPYFYCSKVTPEERDQTGNTHPTVKPLALMRWLCRLITPPAGTVLDPFAGSGTTLIAALLEGYTSIGIEMTDQYLPIIEARIAHTTSQPIQTRLL